MTTLADELLDAAGSIDEVLHELDSACTHIGLVRDRAEAVGRAHCGSWSGYHSTVYFEDLTPPPAGAVFSVEWGLLRPTYSQGTVGSWRQYSFDEVKAEILKDVNVEEWEHSKVQTDAARARVEDAQRDVRSMLLASEYSTDPLVREFLGALEEAKPVSRQEVIQGLFPGNPPLSRDTRALSAGPQTPPHVLMLARAGELLSVIETARQVSRQTRSAAKHVRRLETRGVDSASRIEGTRVFIGHGRSDQWRELKDFVADRLGLPWDEFNRESAAGLPNTARLSQMLDNARIALLMMTAEDIGLDGESRARMNVIHEVGLFQGRLGFSKAIVLLEEGCEEFSNIQGLGQIRYPAGNISAKFEQVRQVMEREGVI